MQEWGGWMINGMRHQFDDLSSILRSYTMEGEKKNSSRLLFLSSNTRQANK